MKLVHLVVPLFLILLPLHTFAAAPRDAELGLVSGTAFIKYEEVDEWIAAESGMPVTEGDQIQVAEGGRVEVRLASGGVVRLDEGSALDVIVLEKGFAQMFLAAGDLYATLPGGKRPVLEIETPIASIRPSPRAAFRVSLAEEGDALEVGVRRGTVHADSARGGWRIDAGRSLYLEESLDEFAPLDPPDEWDEWNRERDTRGIKGHGGHVGGV